MSSKRVALFFYLVVGGLGLWVGMSAQDLLDSGVGQPVINMIQNGTTVGLTVIGGIIIYILGGNKEDVPPLREVSGEEDAPKFDPTAR